MSGQIDGLSWRVDGEVHAGEPLLLLNGGMMSLSAWEPVTRSLAATHRLVRFDFRGQILSPGVPEPSLDAHARDALTILDHLGIERAQVVGTSFGALVGLWLAAEFPERVASLTAMTATARMSAEMDAGTRRLRALARDAAAGGDGGAFFDALVATTYSGEYLSGYAPLFAQRRAQVARLPAQWFAAADALLAAIEGMDLRPRLGAIRAPTIVVAAEADITFPLEFSTELAAAIPGATLRTIPGAAHGVVLEAPELALAAIVESLAEMTAPTP